MTHYPSLRSIREALLAASRAGSIDPIALESLRAEISARLDGIRRAMDRAAEFAAKGLVSEAASVIIDFPDLAREADQLIDIATVDPQTSAAWRAVVGEMVRDEHLPRREEVDRLATIEMRAQQLRPHLDALRLSVLRGEPIRSRMHLLRRLRAEDSRNRMWLDQIEMLENEWLRSIAELRSRTATRAELDEALVALETHDWVASVPRGLREELFAKVKPLRADEAGERYLRLADEIHAAASRMDRADLVRLEREWAAVQHETGRMPSRDVTDIAAPAFAWLSRVDAEEAAQRAFEGEVERLEQMLAERRGAPEIEAQIAILRDAGRAAPNGLVERALRYVDAMRETTRRRHRLVLAGSALGAVALVAVGGMALSMHAAQREREALLVSLREAIATKDAARLGVLVAETHTKFELPGPELAAALKEAEGVLRARAERTDEIRKLVAAAEKEIAARPPRSRLVALRQALVDALADAEPADRAAVQSAESQRVTALESLDATAAEETTAALAALDRALLAWPVPDAWSDSESLDEARWTQYSAMLEGSRRALDDAMRRAEGHEASTTRIGLKQDAIEKRIAEARSRTDQLRAALRDLSEEKLVAPVTSEQQLIGRLEGVLKDHGPVIARQGRLAAFEQALNCADAYRAMEAWRTSVRPKLAASLGPSLVDRPAPEVAAVVATEIRDFLAAHPAAPMRQILARLANDVDPNSGATLWPPQRLEFALVTEGIAGIHEVTLSDARRFYRRPPVAANAPAIQRNPMTRALKSIADLSVDPEQLSSILAVSSDELEGGQFENPVSAAWTRAVRTLAESQSHRVLPTMLELFEATLGATGSDALLRFRSLRDAAALLVQSGHAEGKLRTALDAWQDRCRAEASEALSADWVAAGYDKDQINWRKPRAQAVAALAAFPDVAAMRADVDAESKILGDAMAAFVPVGMLGSRGTSGREREVRVSGTTDELFILVRRGADWTLVPFSIDSMRAGALPAGASDGPTLVYRRNRS